MSHDYDVLQREIDELRRMRDELRLKAHLVRMDARELWDDLEKRWNQLEANAKQLTRESEDALAGVADVVRDTITELHEGYDRLASTLRETHPDSLWDQFRHTFDRLVEGGHRVTERVVGTFEELGDAAKLRMEKARLERTLIKKCAELGTRTYELAKEPLSDGRPPQVLDDDKVKVLLQEVGALDADLQKAAAELSDPGRAEA
ncbi:MAG TPA: hypothetical protein VKM54_28725 [Myxococcota bacterium]|nr:hypothetical protein [Myxococcota bacterium]